METARRTELDEVQHQIGKITDESLESTRRMLNMVEESEDAGRQTMEELDIQKQQLNHIEKSMDDINAGMTEAENSLSRLRRCCNICAVPWKKGADRHEPDQSFKSEAGRNCQIIVDQPQRTNLQSQQNDRNFADSSVGYLPRITNDAREDEMESNLCQVNSILGNLKDMAVDMNSELSQQNDQLKRINTKGDANTIRLDQANVSANNLLKS